MTLPRELKDFTASLSEPVIFVSDEGIVRWVNGSAQGLLAGDCGRLAGTALQLLVDDPVEHVNAFLRLCFRTRRPVPGRLRWRVRAPSQPPRERCTGVLIPGSEVSGPSLVCIRILPLSHGSIASFELLNKKIGNLNNALRALAESQKLLQQERDSAVVTLYSIGDAVITTDADGRVQRLNPVAARLTGWNENEAVGRQLSEVFHIVNEDTREPADDLVRQCLREGRIVGLANHTLLIARDGTEYGIEDSAAPIPRDDDTFSGAVLVFRDVTAQRLANQQLQFLAQRDPLTTLYNRRSFEQHLDAAYHRASRGAERHALIYIDLDQFKLVNDTAGHQVGDQLLVAVARYLHGRVRAGDVLARMGGDEFALLASDIDEDSALALAKDIVKDLNQRLFTLSGENYRVGASAGVAMIDQRSVSAYEAMREADIACYVSKHAGRGQAHLSSEGDQAATSTGSEMKLVNDIRDAITEQRLRIVYQPIVAVADGRVSHYEVLLRMARRDGTLESTAQVITAAERYGVIGELDRWVIQAALAELAAEHRRCHGIRLTINLSGVSMGDPSLQGFIINALVQHQVSGERIVFEVTETAAITGMERAAEFMRGLRTYGCQFALDDFGTGFSSYTHLKYLPLTYLKIDGSFIRGLVRDPVDQAMVRSMTAIASSMGVATVAEYVENQEILDCLRGLGVRLAQGFHISRPLDSPRSNGPEQ